MNQNVSRYADMFAAIGSEPRLRIMQLLFRTYPQGMVVNEIKDKLQIPNSTLSHHLEKLRTENLVTVEKDRQYLCYTANANAMQDLLSFLYVEDYLSNSQSTEKKSTKGENFMSEQLVRPIWEKIFAGLGFPLPSRFTQEAITAIKFAQCESLRLKHKYVGTEQILIGLISEKSGLAWQFLDEAGLNLDRVQSEIERLTGRGNNNSVPMFVPFTRRAKKAIDNALQESLKLSKNYIGTEHVLLGLLEESDSLGFKIIENLEINPRQLEQKLRQALSST